MAENDWIVATLNNPTISPDEMTNVLGLTVENTQILPKDTYLKSSYIKNHDAFKNEDGSFSNQKFDQFYNYALSGWDQFTSDEKIDTFEYSLLDARRKPDSKIRDPHFKFETVLNPDRTTTGITGINVIGERKYTPSELAQTQRIYDSATGQYIDETPNDRALFSSPIKWIENLFQEPLVLATYDEDTEEYDPFQGKVVKHKKGEYKLNSEGTYYAETLNGRSLAGKQVIANSDLLTVDGSTINKYDFFDSDSLDKSVGGTIMKTAASIIPLLCGPVGYVYSGLLIARELAKSLPMLYGMTTSLFGNENEPEFLNTLAGYGEKFTGGISEYGSQHTFSFEQFGKLVGDVAVQWGQQKLIARAVSKLRGSNRVLQDAYKSSLNDYAKQINNLEDQYRLGKITQDEYLKAMELARNAENWAETSFGKIALSKYMPAAEAIVQRNSRLGADAALAYMAIISNYDIYNNMLERGATHKDAAIVSIGSTLGMFSVDKFLHLGEMFFDDLEDQAQRAFRDYVSKESKNLVDDIMRASGMEVQEAGSTLFKRIGQTKNRLNSEVSDITKLIKAKNFGRAVAKEFSNTAKYYKEGIAHHTLGAGGKALGEGLEEVSEEFVSDISKQLYEWAGALGADTSIKDAGAWDNWFDRYAMSFLGGAIGGATFYGVGKFNEAKNVSKQTAKSAEDEMIYLLRQHKKSEILNQLKDLKEKGELASTKLGIKSQTDSKGNRVFLKAEEGELTQNDIVYNMLVSYVNMLDSYITEYGGNLSEDELFKQMVLGDARLMAIKEQLNGESYNSGYRQEFQNTLQQVVSLRNKIDASENTDYTDLQKRRQELAKENKTDNELEQKIQELTKNIDSDKKELAVQLEKLNGFLSGENSLEYARKTIWLSDPKLSSIWTYNTFDQWLKQKHNLTLKNLGVAEIERLKTDYLTDLNLKKDFTTDLAWKSFLDMEKDFTPFLQSLEDPNKIKEIKENLENFGDLRNAIDHIKTSAKLIDWDTKLENESDEEYEHRNDTGEGLSAEEVKALKKKQNARAEKMERINRSIEDTWKYVNEKFQKIIELEKIKDLDPATYRHIRLAYEMLDPEKSQGNDGLTLPAIIRTIITNYITTVKNGKIELTEDFKKLEFDTLKEVTLTIIDSFIENFENSGNRALREQERLNKILELLNSNPKEALESIINESENIDILTELDNRFNADDVLTNDSIDEFLSEDKINIVKEIVESKSVENQKVVEKFFLDDLSTNEVVNQLITFKDEINSSTNLEQLDEVFSAITSYELLVSDNEAEKIVNTIKNASKEIQNLIVSLSNINSKEEIISALSIGSEAIKKVLNSIIWINLTGGLEKETTNKVNTLIDDFIQNLQNKLLSEIDNNSIIKFINKKDSLIRNPLVDILSIVAEKYGISDVDLDTVLTKLQDRIDDETSINEFTLSDPELDILNYLDHILNLVQGYIYQSSNTPNWLHPQGHAKFWNDLAKKNKDIVGEFHLPEIDQDLAELYKRELSEYKKQIEYFKTIHANNAINKERQFNVASDKLELAKINFYRLIQKNLNKIIIRKGSVDHPANLLPEIHETDSSLDIETTLANNLFIFLSTNNISFKEFLKQSKLLENILDGSLENLLEQNPANLDDKLEYNNVSGYQKVQWLLTALLHNSSKFELWNKNDINSEIAKSKEQKKIAPLSIQKQIIQTGKGFINGSLIIQDVYDYIEESGVKIPVPVLNRCMIIEGVGGAGKTQAAINKICKDLNDDEIWIGAPTDVQLNNLALSIGKTAKSFNRENLLSEILENKSEYEITRQNILNNEEDENAKKDKNHVHWDTKKLKIKRSLKPPKVLIIDETTHFSFFEIQLINRWANENNVQVILSGHNNQLGAPEGSGLSNCFTLFKTPLLGISLRESNIHVQNNNTKINDVIDSHKIPEHGLERDQVEEYRKVLFEDLSKIKLTYYLNEEILNGTVITKDLSQELINPLIKESSDNICFIGDINSEIFKQLKDSGIDIPTKNIFKTINDIQGGEFEYVISDVPLEYKTEVSQFYGEESLNQVKTLYTLNTRAKKGLIIIDKDFSSIYGIENVRESNTAQARTITTAVNNFITKENERLSQLDLSGEYHDLSELTTKKEDDKTDDEIDNEDLIDDIDEKIKETEEKAKEKVDEVIKEDKENPKDDPNFVDAGPEDFTERILTPGFSMNTIGYSMPILGGYTRVKDEHGNNVYVKLDNDDGTIKDLSVIINNDEIFRFPDKIHEKIDGKEILSTENLKIAVNQYFHLIKQIPLIANGYGIDKNTQLLNQYIDPDRLRKILKGESKELLPDGRTEGVYLEIEDYGDGDRFIGLGTAEDTKEKMTLNEKVYKYVLRFNGTGIVKGPIAITLALAANPDTWQEKVTKLEKQIKNESNPDIKKTLTEEKTKLINEIDTYKEYLKLAKSYSNPIKIKIKSSFSKIRQLDEAIRLNTLYIPNPRKFNDTSTADYDPGWKEKYSGKYKTVSDIYVLGNDLDDYGIKASNSGKAIIFVSDCDYNKDELYNIYQREKSLGKDSPCTVRMIILENAGLNWSSLTNGTYKEHLFGTKKQDIDFPFKADVMGYRFLTAMWNWRADLTNFLTLYKQEFTDKGYDDDKVLKIIAANDEIYALDKTLLTDLNNTSPEINEICTKYGVLVEDIVKLNIFNQNICKDVHTFRLGAASTGKRIQRLIGIDIDKYFNGSHIPKEVEETKLVFGLAITPKLAKEYNAYINELFKIFNNHEAFTDLDIKRGDDFSSYSIIDRIDGNRLGSLSSAKTSEETRASGKSFTNFLNGLNLKDGKGIIEIKDPITGEPYEISINTKRFWMGQFMFKVIHLFHLLKIQYYLSEDGELTYEPKITIYKSAEKSEDDKVVLDYRELRNLVLASKNGQTLEEHLETIHSDPDKGKFKFEFGDMFDLMLHGSLQDVATNERKFKDGKIAGGRKLGSRITGAMFPRGLFIDPRLPRTDAVVVESEDKKGKYTLLKTTVDGRLLLTTTTTELVYNIELPSLITESEKDVEPISISYQFDKDNLSIESIENIPEIINKDTLIGDKTLQELIPEAKFSNNELKVGESIDVEYQGKNYELHFEKINNLYNLKLIEKQPISKDNNVIETVENFNINEFIYDGSEINTNVKMKNGKSLLDFILEKTGIEDEDDITLKYESGRGILIYSNNEAKVIGQITEKGEYAKQNFEEQDSEIIEKTQNFDNVNELNFNEETIENEINNTEFELTDEEKETINGDFSDIDKFKIMINVLIKQKNNILNSWGTELNNLDDNAKIEKSKELSGMEDTLISKLFDKMLGCGI